jgi:hypothetical protein
MKRSIVGLLLAVLVGLVWASPAFAPTMVEYIAGPFPVRVGQTVRVSLFNVTKRSQLVVIALVDAADGTVIGETKSLTVDPGKGTSEDFLMEEEGMLVGLLRTGPPRQPGGRDFRPGALLHVIDGTSVFPDKYGFTEYGKDG